MEGFQTLRLQAPLGEALIDAVSGEIVSYELQGDLIRVEVLDVLD